MTLSQIALTFGLITGGAGAAGVVYASLDYLDVRPVVSRELRVVKEQVASNTTALALQRWQWLNARRQNQGLTPSELVEFCKLSFILGLRSDGCR